MDTDVIAAIEWIELLAGACTPSSVRGLPPPPPPRSACPLLHENDVLVQKYPIIGVDKLAEPGATEVLLDALDLALRPPGN